MEKKELSRYQFLKSIGFKGSALMAVLASCTQKEDYVLDSLIVNKNGQPVKTLDSTQATALTPSGGTTLPGTTPGGSTGGTTTGGTNLSGKVTTDELNSIKNFLLKIDLTSGSASPLMAAGGYIISNSIVVAAFNPGDYVAAQNLCTHQPRQRIIFNRSEFYCTDHGARFSMTGQGLNSLGSRGLVVYRTANDGKTLLVFS
jgi:nitrite reductase/ring-hydroxylating ferredoxin subunit